MATIEYEKKYKEALGWMQSIYPTMTGADKEDAEHFFPELKESEDERIRKALIKYFKNFDSESLYTVGLNEEDTLAWLEKQQKPTWTQEDEMTLFSVIWHLRDSVNNGNQSSSAGKLESWIRTLKERVLSQPKQSEQKSTDKIEPKFKVGNKIKLAIEPKYPAREIIAIQNDAYYFDKVVYLPFNRQDEWELVEQKPAEWSKEDETMINCCLGAVNTTDYFDEDNKDKMKNWLKSLKDRYTWKPTDEQMKTLKYIAYHLMPGDNCREEMFSLYEDLKKLMEE